MVKWFVLLRKHGWRFFQSESCREGFICSDCGLLFYPIIWTYNSTVLLLVSRFFFSSHRCSFNRNELFVCAYHHQYHIPSLSCKQQFLSAVLRWFNTGDLIQYSCWQPNLIHGKWPKVTEQYSGPLQPIEALLDLERKINGVRKMSPRYFEVAFSVGGQKRRSGVNSDTLILITNRIELKLNFLIQSHSLGLLRSFCKKRRPLWFKQGSLKGLLFWLGDKS